MGLFVFFSKKDRGVQSKVSGHVAEDDILFEQQEMPMEADTIVENSTTDAVETDCVKPARSPEECGRLALECLINETKVSMMRITMVDNQPSVLDSKIGGMPYLLTDEAVPLDKTGNPMRLLVQINCKDLKGLEDFPKEGILQIYLTTDPGWEDFKVRFFADIDESVTPDMIAAKIGSIYKENNDDFPVEREYGMEFLPDEESMSVHDDRLMALFCQYYTELANDWISMPEDAGDEVYEMFESYCDDSFAGGHKVGGYELSAQPPYYFQYEENAKPIDVFAEDSKVLLFQMDSEPSKGIMWGDMGVARFFIKRSDLKAGKWENVYLVWDCS